MSLFAITNKLSLFENTETFFLIIEIARPLSLILIFVGDGKLEMYVILVK